MFIVCWKPMIWSPVLRSCDEGCQWVQRQDHRDQSTVADRLYLPEGYWIGMVLSQHDPGRLQPLHRLVEAMHRHEGWRCDWYAGTGSTGFGLRSGPCLSQTTSRLSDNGSSYVSGDLAEWLQDKGMKHSRGAPYHPQTQGKIERWHQILKNRILLENYFLPSDFEAHIEAFLDHYNY